MRLLHPALFAAALVLVTALHAPADPLDDGKDRSAELGKMMEDAVSGTADSCAEIYKQWILPEAAAWFAKVFGEKPGAAESAFYEQLTREISKISPALDSMKSAEATKARVSRYVHGGKNPDDAQEAGEVLEAM